VNFDCLAIKGIPFGGYFLKLIETLYCCHYSYIKVKSIVCCH